MWLRAEQALPHSEAALAAPPYARLVVTFGIAGHISRPFAVATPRCRMSSQEPGAVQTLGSHQSLPSQDQNWCFRPASSWRQSPFQGGQVSSPHRDLLVRVRIKPMAGKWLLQSPDHFVLLVSSFISPQSMMRISSWRAGAAQDTTHSLCIPFLSPPSRSVHPPVCHGCVSMTPQTSCGQRVFLELAESRV